MLPRACLFCKRKEVSAAVLLSQLWDEKFPRAKQVERQSEVSHVSLHTVATTSANGPDWHSICKFFRQETLETPERETTTN
jgi:hypothetical protein